MHIVFTGKYETRQKRQTERIERDSPLPLACFQKRSGKVLDKLFQMDPGTIFLKVWNGKGEKKAVLVKTYEELLRKGSAKLGLVQNPCIYLEDGTEIDEKVFIGLNNNTVLYFLIEGDHKPWNQSQRELNQSYGASEPVSSKQTEVISVSENMSSPNSLKSWPEAFLVPEQRFSHKLKEDIKKGSLCWITKSELLGILSEGIQKYTLKPTFVQRDIVSRALVLQFPSLKSNIGEGHEGWRLKIYDRVREDLRKRSNQQDQDVSIVRPAQPTNGTIQPSTSFPAQLPLISNSVTEIRMNSDQDLPSI
ncbi:hypothetical protein JTE90_013398 [Oedothorax gibbosus]|uniref:CIDE-N domain-containing protein n=1 Tax=Oedothorax gibbosus TaxID=931172 RepID=A0AAV6TW25_9ARAC|nr:hypothetical protein JTE90_013398 [Oedothorax gibbosus]